MSPRRIADPRRDPVSKIKSHESLKQDRSHTDRGAPANAATFFPQGSFAPDASWYIQVTSGTFGTTWVAPIWLIYRRGLRVQIPWKTDAATTGEVRLNLDINDGTGARYTSAVSLGAASSGIVTFRWAHGFAPWAGAQPWLVVEARRVSGANNVWIQYPGGGAAQVPPAGCTSTGV